MNKQYQLLTWVYQNQEVFPLRSGKIYQAYKETQDYGAKQNSFSELLSKLHGKDLLDKPDYGTYDLTDKGVRLSKNLVDEDLEELSKPEGYGDVVNVLDDFIMEEKLQDVHQALMDGEEIRFSLLNLEKFNYEIVDFFKKNPQTFTDALEEALSLNVEQSVKPRFRVVPDVEWLETSIGNARNSSNIGRPVVVEGIVKKSEQVSPMIVSAVFECVQCGAAYQKEQDSSKVKSPYKCEDCGSRKFDLMEKQFEDVIDFELSYRDQKETTITARITGDPDLGQKVQTDLMTGTRIKVLGVVSDAEQGSNENVKMDSFLEVVDYERSDEKKSVADVSEDKKTEVRERVKQLDDAFDAFALSIAPGLGNMDLPKKCVAASLIGSPEIEDKGSGSKDYGRIHVGIIANPGLGKSNLQNWVKKHIQKTYQAQGKSGSGTGLTATVEQSKGGEWQLVAGKLVFADKGILQIDEFDKFAKGELTSLNSAMESGFFEVDKASVSAELPGRATVIATGNFEGKLDGYKEPYELLPEKGEGLYDRFALMCSITDSGDEAHNAIKGRFMEESDYSSEPEFSVEEVRVFRHLARSCSPRLSDESWKVLKDYIDAANSKSGGELRGESNRFLVHLIKLTLCVARANLHREEATKSDARKAVELMRETRDSLGLDMGDKSASTEMKWRKQLSRIQSKIDEMISPEHQKVDVQELEDKVTDETEINSNVFDDALSELKSEGELFEPESGFVEKV